jgi:predicted phage gp36 major capsid-like protein
VKNPAVKVLTARFDGFVVLINERYQATEQARKIQALEYERRLDSLNNEAGRITKAQEMGVSREKFDGAIGEVFRRLSIIEKNQENEAGSATGKKEQADNTVRNIAATIGVVMFLAACFEFFLLLKK